jgi:hypothetical protein
MVLVALNQILLPRIAEQVAETIRAANGHGGGLAEMQPNSQVCRRRCYCSRDKPVTLRVIYDVGRANNSESGAGKFD